jgi:hypothetical protein
MNIKGFDKDLKCRGFQFEIGKEYKTGAEKLELCTETVFHYCDSIQKVHSFYDVRESRFCEVEALGKVVKDEQKCGTNHIRIVREITGEELNTLIGKINGNTGIFNSGDHNSGYHNSGHHNSGDYNSGDFNSCDFSSGIFCNKDPEVLIFNQPSGMTMQEFRDSQYFYALYGETIELTYWEDDKLKTRDYKEACKLWWKKLTKENQKIIQSMPNFDKKIFKDITGIEVKE